MDLSKVFIAIVFTLLKKGESICLLPPEFGGEYIIQNALTNSDVMQYSTINITAESVFPFGQCFFRNDSNSNIIVVLSPDDNPCYRCFNLQMVSKNVILLIHNSDINSKCSSTAEIAALKCPGARILLNDEKKFQNDFHSIILYRTSERDSPRKREFCPFDFFDDIKFDYYMNEKKLCSGYESTLSQCPSGSMLNMRFLSCEKGSPKAAKYECIGHWSVMGVNYLAVIDWVNATTPRYKCGTYSYASTDETEIELRINSDCSSFSRANGFPRTVGNNQEIFKLKKTPDSKVATDIEFPSWLQGNWQFFAVNKSYAVYRDLSSLKSYSMKLVNQLKDDKFIVLSRSQCGDESFKCLFIRKLDTNVLEFQSSSESAKQLAGNVMLCNDENFDNNRWITLAREGKDVVKTPCPVNGKYLGRLSDDDQQCSMMTSSCNSDIMHFQYGPCGSNEIYEKRVYRCLGQWTDKDSATIFTLTKRVDVVDVFECFAGINSPNGSEKQIIIKEAGDSCYKKLDVENFGMEMNQTAPCQPENAADESVAQPAQDDLSIIYKTDFDGDSNSIDFTTTVSTRKPKTPKNHETQMREDNSVELIASNAHSWMIHSLRLLVMINSIIIIL